MSHHQYPTELHTVCDVSGIQCSLGDKAVLNVNPLLLKGIDVVWR